MPSICRKWDIEKLRERFHLDGQEVYKKTAGGLVPQKFFVNNEGYLAATCFGHYMLKHRMVWMLYYGKNCTILDHINCDKLDNRVENLREVTDRINSQNKKRHHEGKDVGLFHHTDGKYYGQIQIGEDKYFIGPYLSPKVAAKVYWIACRYRHLATGSPTEFKQALLEANLIPAFDLHEGKGYHFHKGHQKYAVRVEYDNKQKHLGLYKTEEEAAEMAQLVKKLKPQHKTIDEFKAAWQAYKKSTVSEE